MKELSHDSECMVKYYGYFITKMEIDQYLKHKYAFIIMECAEMNLEHLLAQHRENQKRFTIENIENFIETVLKALCELEAKHIAHCDIKPENILIMDSKTYKVKLCDVGSCKMVTG
jgi:dual specificity protein kinase YAK1